MLKLTIYFLAIAAAMFGQGNATIVGNVSDSSGAIIPSAEITLVNEATGVTRKAAVDAGGRFEFIRVPVGNYRVSTAATGFKRTEMRAVNLTAEQTLQLDIALSVGEMSQSVDVSDSYSALETATSTLRSVVRRELIEDLPLNGRNALQLQTLLPGAVRQAGARASFSQEDGISVNGSRGNDNNTLVDGGHNNDVYTGVPTSIPNPDALQEFSVLSNNFSAEFGRGSGSIVSAVTKSGTNSIHGTLYEFLRNDALDARSYFAHANLVEKQRLRRNQFGASIGGPAVRDRTFWFASWESVRESRALNQTGLIVPTLSERTGDFSASARKPFDPSTNRLPFPGDRIPAARQSLAAQRLGEILIPRPNVGADQFAYNSPSTDRRDQLLARGDHNFTSNDRLYVSYFFSNLDQTQNFNVPLSNGQGSWTNNRILANYTKVVSPNMVNAFTYTYNRLSFARGPVPILPGEFKGNPPTVAAGLRLSDLGVRTKSATPGYPMNTRLGTIAGYFGFAGENFVEFAPNAHELRNSLTWTKAGHIVKVGGEYAYSVATRNASNESDGNSFNWNASRANNGWAEFLLGLPSSYTQQSILRTDNRFHTIGLFVQDDWKVSRSLTINMGLRWEPGLGIYDGRDEIASFRAGQQSTLFPNAPRGLVYPGDSGISRSTYPTDWNNFGPRAGLAWQPFGSTARTVVRAGYGVFYNSMRGFLLNEAQIAQPFVLRIVRNAPPSFEDPWLNFPGGDPFPFTPPTQSADRLAYRFVVPTGVQRSFDPKNRTSYNQQWHLTLQHEIVGTVFSGAYVGSKGTNLMINYEENQAVFGPGATVANIDQRRPYQNFQSINTAAAIGNSTYHSLQLSANRRLTKGVSIMANYTRSKAIDLQSLDRNAGIIQDTRNFAADKGLADFHRDHNFFATFLAEIPTRWRKGAAGVFTSGWQINGIYNYTSGQPLTIVPGTDRALSGEAPSEPTSVATGDYRRLARLINNAVLTSGRSRSPRHRWVRLVILLVTWLLGLVVITWTWEYSRRPASASGFQPSCVGNSSMPSITPISNPVVAVNSAAFGQINSVTGPRIMQVGLKLRF